MRPVFVGKLNRARTISHPLVDPFLVEPPIGANPEGWKLASSKQFVDRAFVHLEILSHFVNRHNDNWCVHCHARCVADKRFITEGEIEPAAWCGSITGPLVSATRNAVSLDLAYVELLLSFVSGLGLRRTVIERFRDRNRLSLNCEKQNPGTQKSPSAD